MEPRAAWTDSSGGLVTEGGAVQRQTGWFDEGDSVVRATPVNPRKDKAKRDSPLPAPDLLQPYSSERSGQSGSSSH